MDISDEQLRRYSPAQLLKYTLELRKDIRKKENLDAYKSKNISRNRQLRNSRKQYKYPYSTSWFDMPEELREMVINEIDPETVFQFKQCSKLCAEEAGRSKNSMYKIDMNYSEEGTHICFYLTNENRDCPHFRYTFSNSGWGKSKKTTICHEKIKIEDWSQNRLDRFMRNIDNDDEESSEHSYINTLKEEKWEIEEKGDKKSVIAKYLKKFLEEYKYSLKVFENTENLDIKHLKNLQHIVYYSSDVLEDNLMTFEQILKCRETINLQKTQFTFDQILQLEADFIEIAAKDLTNEQIKIYLKMWENGEIGENIGSISIDILNELKILDEEYYIDGLLTVFDREDPAEKRLRSSYEGNYFTLKIKDPRQCDIRIWLIDGGSYSRIRMSRNPRKRRGKSENVADKLKKNASLGLFDIPFELREMIILEMDAKTHSDDLPNSFYENPDDYFCENHKEKWTKVEEGDMKTVVLRYLTNYLDTYHNSIIQFKFRHELITVHDFNVNNLRRLRALEVTQQKEDLLTSGFINFNQLSNIKSILASETNLTFEQLCEYQGEQGCLRCNDFDDKTIKKYLEMIKSGEKDNQLWSLVIMTPKNENLNMDYYTENLKSKDRSVPPEMAQMQEMYLEHHQSLFGPKHFGFTSKTNTNYRFGVATFSLEKDSITVMSL
ncbi:unnamed protein product [Caenorhabditis angaria]|uniref:Sdz-33 F-box domain-containing protein n=1 Tax=Caenorhabditis angaria TaxID=860376 RepID=A0A9P1I7P1_9PELO|nr:unnamed protein product [Caenorhabditis angaria]